MPKLPEYHGIKKGYPRIRRYFGKLAAYVQLCRGFTLVAPLLAGIFGVLTPVKDITFQYLYTAIYVGITLALAQSCGQCLNQYADVELDKTIKKEYRPIPSGLVSREEALGVSWLLAIFALGRAFTISVFFGLITLTLIFFAVFYSLAPFSPRRIHALANVSWMAVSRGLIPMFAVLSLFGDPSEAWKYSILAFMWMLGFQSTKDVPDVDGDKKFGIKTVPGSYGQRGLVTLMVISSIVYAILSAYFKLYIMLLILPVAALAILTTKRQSRLTENTYAWCCMYIGLAMIYLLMFVNERFIL
ncbi:MAG: hypothetical protein D4S01_10620 [Dehalococcoidia bacterium]|nr:MAG: hypothetical protein D4S01_10620 [Dehalococcoidia bacterium]